MMRPEDMDCWDVADAVLAAPAEVAPRVLLYGPPGTGKTYAAIRAAADGQDVFPVTLTDETPAAEVRGHYVPQGGDAGWRWMHGPGVLAWMAGGVLVLNEIDHASGDAMDLILVLADDPESARLVLPSGEMVSPAAGLRIVATCNGDPADLPDALRDRFSSCAILIDHPHPAAIATLPQDLQAAARNLSAADDPDRRIGLRAWMSYARMREVIGEDVAARAAFGMRAGEMLSALTIARGGVSDASGDPDLSPFDVDYGPYLRAGYCGPCRADLARTGGESPGGGCGGDCPNASGEDNGDALRIVLAGGDPTTTTEDGDAHTHTHCSCFDAEDGETENAGTCCECGATR